MAQRRRFSKEFQHKAVQMARGAKLSITWKERRRFEGKASRGMKNWPGSNESWLA